MDRQLPFEKISEAGFYCWVELLTIFSINFESLPLADFLPKLLIITWQNELHELCVSQTTAVVQVVELHHELHILNAVTITVVLLEELVDIHGVDLLVFVSVDPVEGSKWLEVIQVSQLDPCLLNTKF